MTKITVFSCSHDLKKLTETFVPVLDCPKHMAPSTWLKVFVKNSIALYTSTIRNPDS